MIIADLVNRKGFETGLIHHVVPKQLSGKKIRTCVRTDVTRVQLAANDAQAKYKVVTLFIGNKINPQENASPDCTGLT